MRLRANSISDGAIFATPRMLESLIRLAEAFAKMELRMSVTHQDVEDAYELLSEATFKSAMDPVTGKIDMQALRTGVSLRDRKLMEVGQNKLLEILQESTCEYDVAKQKLNEELNKRNLGMLRDKYFREVVEHLCRDGTVVKRGNTLHVP